MHMLSIQLTFDQQGKNRETKTGGKLKKRKNDQRMRRIKFSKRCLEKKDTKGVIRSRKLKKTENIITKRTRVSQEPEIAHIVFNLTSNVYRK